MNFKNASQAYSDLDPQKLPAHVAIIMDGNGRWAKKRLLNRVKGHERGVQTVRTIVRTSREIGISVLTLYAFSTENWQRPQPEISALMAILKKFLRSEQDELNQQNIQLSAIGQVERLPADVKRQLNETMTLTSPNTGMKLNLALSYGGRTELTEMVRKLCEKAVNRKIKPSEITEHTISDHLYTAGLPDPDILIRTSGEMRISNFLLWQIAYAEIFVTQTLWPDFEKEEYLSILKAFQLRKRRFGTVEA